MYKGLLNWVTNPHPVHSHTYYVTILSLPHHVFSLRSRYCTPRKTNKTRWALFLRMSEAVCCSRAPCGANRMGWRGVGSVVGRTAEVTLHDHQWAVNNYPLPSPHHLCDIWSVRTSEQRSARATSGHTHDRVGFGAPTITRLDVCIFKIITSTSSPI
jgi:hypothetical protein